MNKSCPSESPKCLPLKISCCNEHNYKAPVIVQNIIKTISNAMKEFQGHLNLTMFTIPFKSPYIIWLNKAALQN